jgi:hypothetical protein
LRLFEEVLFLSLDFLVHFTEKSIRMCVPFLNDLVSRFELILFLLLFGETVLSGLVLLLGGIKVLHPVFEDGVDGSYVETLGGELLGVRRKLILLSGDFRLEIFLLLLRLGLAVTVFAKVVGLVEDLSLNLLVVFLLAFKLGLLALKFALSLVVELFQITVLLSSLVNERVTTLDVLDGLLPLQVELVTLLMESAEFFSGLVKLDLSSLGLGDFILELLALASDFDSQLFDL